MSLFVNRATLRVQCGKQYSLEAKADAWKYFNRLLMAQKLARAANFYGRFSPRRNLQMIRSLEKRLRFMENSGAIKIHRGKIHYENSIKDLEDQGQGVINVKKTMADAVCLAAEQILHNLDWENDEGAYFSRTYDLLSEEKEAKRLFYKSNDLEVITDGLRFKWMRSFLFNPLLKLVARETAAAVALSNMSRDITTLAHMKCKTRHPETRPNMNWLEGKIKGTRKLSMAAVALPFDPVNCKPYDQHIEPIKDFKLKPTSTDPKKQMVFVISDTHLKPAVHPKTNELLRLCYLALQHGITLVKNGDIFDFFVWRSTMGKIQSINQKIIRAFHRLLCLYIPGNHDQQIKEMAGAEGCLSERDIVAKQGYYYGDHVYIAHGHQMDPQNKDGNKSGYYAVKILTFLEQRKTIKWLFPNFMQWAEVGYRLLFGKEWPAMKKDLILGGVRKIFHQCEKLEKTGAFTKENPLIVILGHEHGLGYELTLQEIVRAVYSDPELAGRARLFFSGSWKEGNATFLAIDYSQYDKEGGRIFVYPFVWKQDHPQFVHFGQEEAGAA